MSHRRNSDRSVDRSKSCNFLNVPHNVMLTEQIFRSILPINLANDSSRQKQKRTFTEKMKSLKSRLFKDFIRSSKLFEFYIHAFNRWKVT